MQNQNFKNPQQILKIPTNKIFKNINTGKMRFKLGQNLIYARKATKVEK